MAPPPPRSALGARSQDREDQSHHEQRRNVTDEVPPLFRVDEADEPEF
jgi:hypothetical protein